MSFSFHEIDDFAATAGRAAEMLYNAKGDRLFVTTAKPGFVNVYDNSDPRHPKFLQAIPAANGAHHSCSRRMSITCSYRTACSTWRA